MKPVPWGRPFVAGERGARALSFLDNRSVRTRDPHAIRRKDPATVVTIEMIKRREGFDRMWFNRTVEACLASPPMLDTSCKKNVDICIIGAGSSGVAVGKALRERGLTFDCFERGSDIGGMWRYENDNGQSCAYRSLHIDTSRKSLG